MRFIASVASLVAIFLLGTQALPKVWKPSASNVVAIPYGDIAPEVRYALDHWYEEDAGRSPRLLQ